MKWFRRPAELVALGALAACGPGRPPPAPPAAPPAPIALSEWGVTALTDLLRMEDRLIGDTVRLGELADHPEVAVRTRVALAAGRIGGAGTTRVLLRLLSDSVAEVRAHAAFGLAIAADSAAPVVDSLVAVVFGAMPDDPAAREAVFALGRIGTDRARSAVLGLIGEDARPNATVAAEALLVSWRFRRDPALLRAIVRHAASTDPTVRRHAVYSLARAPAPAAVTALLHALSDEDAYVRSLAARGLAPAVVDTAGRRAAALDALLAALRDAHPHVRINAAASVGRYRDPAAVRPLVALLHAPDGNEAVAAAGALGAIGPNDQAAGALAAAARDPLRHRGVRAAALAALVRVAPRLAAGIAGEWADSAAWLARLHAARALAQLPWADAAPLLERLVRDPDGRVAEAALGAARASSDSAAAARAFFVQGLAHEDAAARAAALRGLGAAADPADFALIIEGYARAERDTEPDAAVAAIDALAALGRRGVPVARAFYLRFPRSANATVQRRARAALGDGDWGEPDAIDHDRGPEHYERIVRTLVAPAIANGSRPVVEIRTASGVIRVELAAAEAPRTVYNFLELVRSGYYAPAGGDPDAARWHRVVPNFVLQDGDSRGDGSGGPGHTIRDEVNPLRYTRGMVGMAHAGPNTAGGQFFITHSPQPHLDGAYTVFGRVVGGMDVADRVVQDEPIESITIVP